MNIYSPILLLLAVTCVPILILMGIVLAHRFVTRSSRKKTDEIASKTAQARSDFDDNVKALEACRALEREARLAQRRLEIALDAYNLNYLRPACTTSECRTERKEGVESEPRRED